MSDDATSNWLTESWNKHAFWSWMGLRIVEAHDGFARVELEVRSHHRGGGGTDAVNGGVIAYLLDGVMGAAAAARPAPLTQVTVTMQVEYLRPLFGDRVLAEGCVVDQGTRLVFLDGLVHDEAGTLCARGHGVYRIFPSKPREITDNK